MTPKHDALEQARRKLAAAPADLRFAVLFTPRGQREALTALFAVYVEIREILRECSDAGVAQAKLAWWRKEISLLGERKPRHPLSLNLLATSEKRVLPIQPFLDIIESVRADIAVPSFPHFADVERHCHRRGGALVELAALLRGAQQQTTLDAAHRLGAAWQLADIVAQGAVYAEHRRVYFAADDLRKHGVDRHIVGDAHTDTGLKKLLADYAQRARTLRDTAKAGITAECDMLCSGWILNGLAEARLKKITRPDYKPSGAPVELRPLAALITAWRSARAAAR